jgi:hypothetical protein
MERKIIPLKRPLRLNFCEKKRLLILLLPFQDEKDAINLKEEENNKTADASGTISILEE